MLCMKERFLVGDIGGTKTLLAIVSEGFVFDRIEKFSSQEYSSLEEIIEIFLKKESVTKACFGVAGPVFNNVCHTTNLPWVIEGKKLSETFNIPTVFVLNDLTSTAYGISIKDCYTINKGESCEEGNIAIIAPGTGLGEALLIVNEGKQIPIASEGGHSDFAPRNEREVELYKHLRKKFSHVSYERILTGQGLSDLYFFLTHGVEKNPQAITEEALLLKSSRERVAVKWFCEILGAESGNLALKGYALGGVFIAGGIAPKILEILKEEDFLRGFFDKGRLSNLLKKVSVHVLLNPYVVLHGAIRVCQIN